jgi:integral membrane protein
MYFLINFKKNNMGEGGGSFQKNSVRLSGLLEGISYLLLLGVAVPLKYIAHKPEMVRFVGMAHGILFIWYILAVIQLKFKYKLSAGNTALALVASLLPAGTFYADMKIFRKLV